MRRLAALALLLAACRREEPPAPAVVAPVPVVPPADGLPGVEEVPSFLHDRSGGALAPPPEIRGPAPTAPAEPDDSFAYIAPSPGEGAAPQEPAIDPDLEEEEEAEDEPADADEPAAADDCLPLRAAMEKRADYVKRAAAERDRFGYVEDDGDSSALRLLESLRRCGENPDDPDCVTPPIEVDVSEREAPDHVAERDPSELDAENQDPSGVREDPVLVDLAHRLDACEKKKIVQPLLER